MAFGPIMQFTVGELNIELAPLTRDSMSEFVNLDHGGGMQRHQVTRYLGRRQAPTVEDEHEWFDRARADKDTLIWGIWVVDGDNRTLNGSSKALGRSGYTYVYTERNEVYSDGQLRHLDCFECLNPLDLFWRQWWHGDRPSAKALHARQLTREVMAWAEENVTLA